jgi:hypothetical protein
MDNQLGQDFKRVAFGMTRRHWWSTQSELQYYIFSSFNSLTGSPIFIFFYLLPFSSFLSINRNLTKLHRLTYLSIALYTLLSDKTPKKCNRPALTCTSCVYYADRHGHNDQDVQESCCKHPHPQHAVQLKIPSHWRHHTYYPPFLKLFVFTL